MGKSGNDFIKGKISSPEMAGDLGFGSVAIYSVFWGGIANFSYTLGKDYGLMTTCLRLQQQRRADERHKSEVIEYMKEKGYLP